MIMMMSILEGRATRCKIILCFAMILVPFVSSFSAPSALQMTYRPPVQSSVSKIRSSRFSSCNSNGSDTQRRQAAAGSLVTSPQDTSPPSSPSFEGRMRGLLLGKQERTTTQRKLPPNVFTVESLEDYKHTVGEEDAKLVCVRFYAPWCKACKAVQPLFYHMANTFPNVKFVDVPCTNKNSNLHQGLDVPSLPFGHIYHPDGGLVEELRMTRKCIPSFATKLQSYVKGNCELQGVGDVTSPYQPDTSSKSD